MMKDKLKQFREYKKWGVRIQDSSIVQSYQAKFSILFELEGD